MCSPLCYEVSLGAHMGPCTYPESFHPVTAGKRNHSGCYPAGREMWRSWHQPGLPFDMIKSRLRSLGSLLCWLSCRSCEVGSWGVCIGSIRCCFGSGVLLPNTQPARHGGGLRAPARAKAGSALVPWGHRGTMGRCSPML